jgi:hypothetical protein
MIDYEILVGKSLVRKKVISSSLYLTFATVLLSVFNIISFYESLVGNTSVYLMKYISFLLFVIVLACRKIKGSKQVDVLSLLFVFIISYGSMLTLLNTESEGISSTILYIILGIGVAFCTVVFFSNLTKEDFYMIMWIVLISISLLVIAPSLIQSQTATSYYISTEGRFRFNGIFNNSNELARFCLLSLFLSLRFLSVYKKKLITSFLWLIVISSLYVIYISDSRTCLFIAIIAIIIYCLIGMFLKSTAITFLFVYFTVFTLLAAVFPKVYEWVSQTSFTELDRLASGRLDIWNQVFDKDFIDLLLGTGTIREGLASTAVLVSGYIELIQYLGITGLLFWLLFIGQMLIKKIKGAFNVPTKSQLQGVSIIILFMLYYFFEGGLVSIGNIASIYFWIELAKRGV